MDKQHTLRIGAKTLVSANPLHSHRCADYTMVTDFGLDSKWLPTPSNDTVIPFRITKLLNDEWVYVLHIGAGPRLQVSRKALQDRVKGDALVAFQYTGVSCMGNIAAYYGMLIADERNQEEIQGSVHRRCRASAD